MSIHVSHPNEKISHSWGWKWMESQMIIDFRLHMSDNDFWTQIFCWKFATYSVADCQSSRCVFFYMKYFIMQLTFSEKRHRIEFLFFIPFSAWIVAEYLWVRLKLIFFIHSLSFCTVTLSDGYTWLLRAFLSVLWRYIL